MPIKNPETIAIGWMVGVGTINDAHFHWTIFYDDFAIWAILYN